MRKPKRKYTRKVSIIAPFRENLQGEPKSTTEALKETGGSKPLLVVNSIEPDEVKQSDIDILPPSLKYQLEAMTRTRKMFNLPDNLKERAEAMVRNFRGDKPR